MKFPIFICFFVAVNTLPVRASCITDYERWFDRHMNGLTGKPMPKGRERSELVIRKLRKLQSQYGMTISEAISCASEGARLSNDKRGTRNITTTLTINGKVIIMSSEISQQ